MMKVLSLLGKNKSALSNIVGYVLLISVTLSLSILVYGWLRFYVSESDIETCSDNVNVIIESYECSGGAGGSLTVTLKNKGLFTVDGYILRVHNRTDAEFGFYTFNDTGTMIRPGEEHIDIYNFPFGDEDITTITLVEVQPFIREDSGSDKISCKSYASQRVECT